MWRWNSSHFFNHQSIVRTELTLKIIYVESNIRKSISKSIIKLFGPFIYLYICVHTYTYIYLFKFNYYIFFKNIYLFHQTLNYFSQLRHCVEKTSLHLYLVATIPVIKKTEILIGHYSPDTASSCACGSPANCQARKIKYPPLTAVKNNRITSTASVVKENSRQHSPPSRSSSPVLQPRSNRREYV